MPRSKQISDFTRLIERDPPLLWRGVQHPVLDEEDKRHFFREGAGLWRTLGQRLLIACALAGFVPTGT